MEWALNLLKSERKNVLQQLQACPGSEHSLSEGKRYIERVRSLQAYNKRIDSLKKSISTFIAQASYVPKPMHTISLS